MLQALITCDQFLASRFELPEAGQWAELDQGVTVLEDPPDIDHGNAVLNLSKAFGEYVQTMLRGYPCFDLGLLTTRRPDTVRFPAVSYFLAGERFLEADKAATDTVPSLIVEMASTKRRRAEMPSRVNEYLAWGVAAVWVVDPRLKIVSIYEPAHEPRVLTTAESIDNCPPLAGFQMAVSDLFVEPKWWTR